MKAFISIVQFFKGVAQRLVAWRQLGNWLAKCINLRPDFQVQNQLYSLPKTPIAPNRCCVLDFYLFQLAILSILESKIHLCVSN